MKRGAKKGRTPPTKLVAVRLPLDLHERIMGRVTTKRGEFTRFMVEAVEEKLGR